MDSPSPDNGGWPLKLRLRRWGGRLAFRMAGRAPVPGLRILTYHDVPDAPVPGEWDQMTTPRPIFERQMRWLKAQGTRVLSADEVSACVTGAAPWPEEPAVHLTFDDGYRSVLRNAWPVLRELEFPCSLFLATGLIGAGPERLTWDEVRQLSETGLVACGSHSVSHRKLAGMGQDELREELGRSKHEIESRTGHPVTLLAYPYGSFDAVDARAAAAAREHGYVGAMTTVAGINRATTDRFRLRRTRVSWVDGPAEFPMTVSGAFDWYAAYQRIRG